MRHWRTASLIQVAIVTTALVWSGAAARVSEAFELRVRGAAVLSLDAQAAGTTLQLSGVLRDELGAPLPQRDVELVVTSLDAGTRVARVTLRTDMQGRFTSQHRLQAGNYQATVRFIEDEHLEGAQAQAKRELRALPVKVEAQGPGFVLGEARAAPLRVRASVGGVGVRDVLRVTREGQEVGAITLDHYGRGALELKELLTPGDNLFTVTLGGELASAAPAGSALSSQTSVRYAPLDQLTLTTRARYTYRSLARGLVVSGRVETPQGPAPEQELRVAFRRESEGGEEAVAQERARTSASGEFEAFLPDARLSDGVWVGEVTLIPDAGAWHRVKTEPIMIERAASRWTLNLVGALAILIGLLALFARALRQAQDAWQQRRWRQVLARDLSPEPHEALRVEALDALPEGEQAAELDAVGGLVWDVWRKRPVAGAEVTLQAEGADGPALSARTNARGHFIIGPGAPGVYELAVSAPGFARGKIEVTLPHTGQWSACRMGLVAMPLKVRRYYQAWVRKHHGEEVWGALTPREIEAAIWGAFTQVVAPDEATRDALRREVDEAQGSTSGEVEARLLGLTRLIEEGYFSGRVQDERLWEAVLAVTRRLEATLPGAGGGA